MKIKIESQPDDSTCGPTSLQAVYNYYNDNIDLDTVIKEVTYMDNGGTLAVFLACHALNRGYAATIYTFNLKIFDPSWDFSDKELLISKLNQQKKYKPSVRLQQATKAYINFLELGGEVKYQDLTPSLLGKYLENNIPILTGLSATYLYNYKRELTDDNDRSIYDDIKGKPMGHFVVLSGFDKENNVEVSDPYHENPVSGNNYYNVGIQRLINSIMLGIITYDANLLILKKK